MNVNARDPNVHEEYAMVGNVRIGNVEVESNGRRFQDTPPNFAATMRSLRVEIQSYRVDNERLIKAQEEHNQLNATLLHSLTEIQRKMNSGDQIVKPEGSKNTTRGRNQYPSGSSDFEKSTDGSRFSSHENKRKRSPSGSSDSERSIEYSGSPSHRGRRKRRYQNCS